jgi:hypothetical protein
LYHGPKIRFRLERVIRGFYGVSARLRSFQGTAKLITETFGYRLVEETGNRARSASYVLVRFRASARSVERSKTAVQVQALQTRKTNT